MEAIVFLIILGIAVIFLLKVAARGRPDRYLQSQALQARQDQREIQKKFTRPPDSIALEIHYTDASKGDSVRVIDRMRVQDGMLVAFCHLRGESRTFRLDRIRLAADIHTGEVIEDIELFLAKDDPSRMFLLAHKDMFQVLFYVGKADGRFHAKQKAVMHRAVAEIGGDSSLSKEAFDVMIRRLGDPVSSAEFRKILQRMAYASPDLLRQIHAIAKEMVAVKKEAHADEISALGDFDRVMSMNGVKSIT